MADDAGMNIIHEGLESLVKDPTATEDFTKDVEEVLKKADQLIAQKRFDDATEEILILEKKCRQASDAISVSKLVLKILTMYKEAGDWAKVKENIVNLSKKRGQLRRPVTDMVRTAMGWTEGLKGEAKLDFIQVLDGVTEGRIYVEVERARLIRTMADMKEAEGDIEAAAQMLQEIQVETFGSMDKLEKSRYILNQMRLVLKKKDYIRVQIASRKINPKFLDADDFQEIKIEFYNYMVAYWCHEENFYEVTLCYQKMFNTKIIQEDDKKWMPILENWIVYLLLAAHSTEQVELINTTLKEVPRKNLERVQELTDLTKEFLANKLISWPVKCEANLKKQPALQDKKRWDCFRKRVVQHDIRIISMYYERITVKRLTELLILNAKEVEAELSELVVNKTLYARIDRPSGIVRFGKETKTEERLNGWSGSIDKIVELVQDTCHMIQKERMVQEARAKIAKKK